jgi:hypothetical protein
VSKPDVPPPTGAPVAFVPPTGAPTQAAYGPPNAAQSFLLPQKPHATIIDAVFALALIAAGFNFWNWSVATADFAGIGTTLFFLGCIAATAAYLRACGIRQSRRSLLALALAVLGSLPFVLYGARDINSLLLLGEGCACLMWVAISCKATLLPHLDGLIVIDGLRQLLVVPFVIFWQAVHQPRVVLLCG